MDSVYAPDPEDGYEREEEGRRQQFAQLYCTLPSYDSDLFWLKIESVDMPIEVLVILLRRCEELQGRNRLVALILQRIQVANERWALAVTKEIAQRSGDRQGLVSDLCADLAERIFRALLDPARLFWEEHFWHCLYFERKHVYQAWLKREGHWYNERGRRSKRVPRVLLDPLEHRSLLTDVENEGLEIEDVGAQRMLDAVDGSELLHHVLCLPERLKAVVVLFFWEGRTEKEIAQLLGISDRTVRNRVQSALRLLRIVLANEGGMSYG